MVIDFSVFPDVLFSNDKPITDKSGLESCAVEEFFRGRSRWNILADDLNEFYPHDPSACLSFMTPDAFAFFLPVFMRMVVLGCEIFGAFPDSLFYELARVCADAGGERLDAISNSYSDNQLKVIGDFLNIAEKDEIFSCFHDLISGVRINFENKLGI